MVAGSVWIVSCIVLRTELGDMKMKKEPLLKGATGSGRSCAVGYAVAAGVLLGLIVAVVHPSDLFDFGSGTPSAPSDYNQVYLLRSSVVLIDCSEP